MKRHLATGRIHLIFFAEPGTIRNMKQTVNTDGSVTLSWDPPSKNNCGKLEYIVTTTTRTSDNQFTIKSQAKTKTYQIKVYFVIFLSLSTMYELFTIVSQ